jgi:drug/metabolite transporter (DMT)-like permease
MRSDIKSGVEYAVITLLVAGICLWQLLSGANEPDPPAAKIAVMGLGMLVASAMHCVFMMQLVRRTGRPFAPWFVAVVIFMPLGTAVLLALLLSESEASES